MDYGKIIEQLFIIVTELDARECSNNCPTYMSEFSWDSLCDMGISLFERLKEPQQTSKNS